MRNLLTAAALLLGSVAVLAQGGAVTYTTEDGPSAACLSDGNRVNGVNQRGDIVGRCANGSGPLSWVLFKGSTPSLIDFSSAPFFAQFSGSSTTRAIDSAGDIVGRWFDQTGHSHGYLLTGDGFVSIDAPQSLSSDTITDTDARGVNNPGTIIGFYNVNHDFDPPNNVIPGIAHGFLLRRGAFTAIDYPSAVATLPRGINDAGDVVGWYINADTTQKPPAVSIHGFVYSKGVYSTIDVPSSFDSPAPTATLLSGINEQGQIAGDYTTAPVSFTTLIGDSFKVPSRCFVRSADGSTFTHIDVPNALATECRGGINDHGNVVGTYVVDASGTEHGFETNR